MTDLCLYGSTIVQIVPTWQQEGLIQSPLEQKLDMGLVSAEPVQYLHTVETSFTERMLSRMHLQSNSDLVSRIWSRGQDGADHGYVKTSSLAMIALTRSGPWKTRSPQYEVLFQQENEKKENNMIAELVEVLNIAKAKQWVQKDLLAEPPPLMSW